MKINNTRVQSNEDVGYKYCICDANLVVTVAFFFLAESCFVIFILSFLNCGFLWHIGACVFLKGNHNNDQELAKNVSYQHTSLVSWTFASRVTVFSKC